MTISDAAFGCVDNTIRLRSGRYFDLADPQPEQVDISDIAGALSKICRFGGQVGRYYSVAEHSVHCAGVAHVDGLCLDAQRAVFLHDAAEAYIGDVVKPIKVMLPDYARIEARVEAAIGVRFGIDFTIWADVIRGIDRGMLIAERKALFGHDGIEWTGEKTARVLAADFQCWYPSVAESTFRAVAATLGLLGAGA